MNARIDCRTKDALEKREAHFCEEALAAHLAHLRGRYRKRAGASALGGGACPKSAL
jgi:hypothetical protein